MHRIAGLALVAILAVACGNGLAPSKASSSSSVTAPSQSTLPFPIPTGGLTPPPPQVIACASPIPAGHQLALVNLYGIQGFVVRDVTDVAHPLTLCSSSGSGMPRFISSTRISYTVVAHVGLGVAGAIYVFDLSSGATSLVRVWNPIDSSITLYAWSPDGRKVTYLTDDGTNTVVWHLLSATGDETLASLGLRKEGTYSNDNDVEMVGFSADGQYVAIDETFIAQAGTPWIRVVRLSDGRTVYTSLDGTMATWAATGARLYFRTNVGVQVWDATGSVVTVSAALLWSGPEPSSDGNHIVFSTLNPQGNHLVNVLDTNNGSIAQTSGAPRTKAAFLTPTLIWYQGEVPCTTPCASTIPTQTGKRFIYDLAGRVESSSIDYLFFDSWPHLVGQS